MNKIFFSIVIPTYNSVETIRATLSSITDQTFNKDNVEIIIVDDYSLDCTFKYIKSLIKEEFKKFNIKLYRLKKNSGRPAVPRNYGINKARGKYIAFCDSDDIWHPKKLEIQYNFLKKSDIQDIAIYSSTKDFIDEEKIVYSNLSKFIFKKTSFFTQRLKNTIKLSSLVVNKKHFLKFGFFDEDDLLTAVEDYELCLRLLLHGKVKFYKIKEFLVFYRISANSISTNKIKMLRRVFFIQRKFSNQSKFFKYFEIYFFMLSYIIFSIHYRLILRKS